MNSSDSNRSKFEVNHVLGHAITRLRWFFVAMLGTGLLAPVQAQTYTIVAYNDLGMHCMQNDFSQMMILPPFNTVRAQVIRRSGSPEPIWEGITLRYEMPMNTHSSDKTNFWEFAQPLLGVDLPRDVGLGGFGLRGTMTPTAARRDFSAVGIPVTPIDDDGREDPYPLMLITARNSAGTVVGQTQTVVPVSWEISCNICHNTAGISTATDILRAHDRLHATTLEQSQPVTCAACHADPALGAPGVAGVSNFSAAMHGSHASRMSAVTLDNECYACHPGFRTNCQRDVHAANNVVCQSCHGGMAEVASPSRIPWVTEPRCDNCHSRSRFEFEQANTLYRDSVGHGGVQCWVCHGSPHSIAPATTPKDNIQAIRLQNHPGKLDTCTVCHTQTPDDPFPHRRDD